MTHHNTVSASVACVAWMKRSVIRGGQMLQGYSPDFTSLHPGYGVVTWKRVASSLTSAGIEKFGFVVLLYTKSSFHPTCIESGATGAITTGCRSGGVISMRGPANG